MKNKKGNVAVIAAIIAIVAITAGVIGWKFAKKTQAPIETRTTVQQPVINAVDQNQVATQQAEGIVYKNEKYGFQLTLPKYFEGYKIAVFGRNQYSWKPEIEEVFFYLPISNLSEKDKKEFQINSIKPKSISDLAVSDYIFLDKSSGKYYSYAIKISIYDVGKWNDKYAKGKCGTKNEKTMECGFDDLVLAKNSKYVFSYFFSQDIYPEEIDRKVSKNSDEIISILKGSFKVVDGETAGWQTYRNEKYGFEITFPKDVTSYEFKERDLSSANAYNPIHEINFGKNKNDFYEGENGGLLSVWVFDWKKCQSQTLDKQNKKFCDNHKSDGIGSWKAWDEEKNEFSANDFWINNGKYLYLFEANRIVGNEIRDDNQEKFIKSLKIKID